MKIVFHYISYSLLLVFSFSVLNFSQDNPQTMQYSIYSGVTLPLTDFGSTTTNEAGFANTGFCGMLESSNILNKSINWTSTLSLAINDIDESSLEDEIGNTITSAGSYVNFFFMTGIGFETNISPSAKLYGLGQIGLLLTSVKI